MKRVEQNKITPTMQKVAADILMEFMFTRDMDDVVEVYNKVFERYGLYEDPFTHIPCTTEEYAESNIEYEKQLMDMKYGHHDGLED